MSEHGSTNISAEEFRAKAHAWFANQRAKFVIHQPSLIGYRAWREGLIRPLMWAALLRNYCDCEECMRGREAPQQVPETD